MGSDKQTVVGIGASAGGLGALKRLFEHVPSDCGLTFVVVMHLSPEHPSHLADLLQSSVRFPVRQVVETTKLEPNNVYVIPPNSNLSAIDTHLRLSKLEEQRRERAPIDHFFRTLAATHDGHAIGVILSGTGSDGTLGLKEIKAKGGLIVVQDPNEAEFDGMPQSAIATGMVDRILTLSEIPDTLVRYSRTEPQVPTEEDSKETEHAERVLLPKVTAVLRARTDRDFSRYKPATLLRRIARRMQLNYIDEFDAYLEKLREQPEEARALGDDLLITVTSFFRDAEVFGKLEKEVIPKLFAEKGPNDTVRVWTVGCATGEEAYSIAMLLLEEADRTEMPPQIQIFASDLHKRSLDTAREGVYSGDIETDVTEERLKRFFQKENGGYRIRKEVRDLVVFAPHNLLSDPPFSRVQLITCRNLLIYLDRTVQRDVVDLFHYALTADGYLLLGSAETIEASDLFRTGDKKLCLYQKRNVPAPEPRLPVFPYTRVRTAGEHIRPDIGVEEMPEVAPYRSVHQDLLERYAPPSILVGNDNRLVHLSENAGRYLLHPGGELTAGVLKLVREELRMELRALLQAARDRKEPQVSGPIPVKFNGHPNLVIMTVQPARDPRQEGYALVIFNELRGAGEPEEGSTAAPVEGTEGERIHQLETELSLTRQRLQAIIEEYETSQEEMKAANEEMQSSNEELRSTMEELETSKEELQSINEELQTVNQENRHKVEELSQLSNDLQNLLAATDIATLFLDRDLRIMRFTPKVAELFSVRVTDRGRPISDLTDRLGYGELRGDAEGVLSRLIPVEREIRDQTGKWYLTRVLPYRSTEDHIEGVVITFIDITSQKRAELALRESEKELAAELGAMRKLHGLVAGLLSNPELAAALQATLDSAMDVTQAQMGIVQLLDARSGKLEMVAHRGFRHDSAAEAQAAEEVRSALVGKAVKEKRREAITDMEGESGADVEGARAAGYRSVQVTPLVTRRGRTIGTLSTYYSAPHALPERERRALDLYTQQAADFVDGRRADEELRRGDERFRQALEIETVGVIFFQLDGAITWANEGFLRQTGFTREDVAGGGVRWDELTAPEWMPRAVEAVEEFKQTGSIRPYEKEYVRKDGTRWWGVLAATRFTEREGVEYIIDITHRKQAEQALAKREREFNAIANLVPDLLWRTEPDERLNWYSKRWREYTGEPKDEESLAWIDLIHPEDRERWLTSDRDAEESGQLAREDLRLKGKDGGYRWFLVQGRPFQDGKGQILCATDFDAERQATDALRRSLVEKEDLLKEIHHRVKNNLQIITSLLNLQSRQVRDEATKGFFEETRNRVQSIASIHEIIYRSESIAAVELGMYLRRLVPEIVRLYDSGQKIEVEILGDSVTMDAQRAIPFGLLVNELVSNVCKHAFPGGGGRLTVKIERQGPDLILMLQDTGVGLPGKFDYEKTETLGVDLVKSLARQLRAAVSFESNRGTCVTVRMAVDKAKGG